MMHRAAATGQEISALEAVTIDAVSLEASEPDKIYALTLRVCVAVAATQAC